MDVFLSELAKINLKQLTKYLEEQWGDKVKAEFLIKLTRRIEQISSYPESCPKSMQFGGIYKCIITKQTTLFYRVNFDKDEIEIITLLDSRQDPDRLIRILQ